MKMTSEITIIFARNVDHFNYLEENTKDMEACTIVCHSKT